MPRGLFARLMLLLFAVLAAMALVVIVLLRVAMVDTAAAYVTRSLQTQIVAVDSLLASADRANAEARLSALGLERRADAPAVRPRRFVLWRDVMSALDARLGDREVRIAAQPRPMLWVAARRKEDGWIGIPLPGLRDSLRATTALGLALAILIVAAAAAIATRWLVGPLRTLAAAAPRIAAGEPAPALSHGAAMEIGELRDALDQAAADVQSANREREIMLAGISHDMRTPLARLGIALEMIGGDEELKRGMATDIAEIDAIVGQFIGFVRDGRDERARETDLGALIDEAIAAQQRAGRVWTRLGAPHRLLRAKPLALRRAIDNLLENAARHGRAPFEAELLIAGDEAIVCVRDRGSGVPGDKIGALGRPFHRVDAARGGTGSGLGLAIAARAAAAHGGSLELRNRKDGGFEARLVLVAARS